MLAREPRQYQGAVECGTTRCCGTPCGSVGPPQHAWRRASCTSSRSSDRTRCCESPRALQTSNAAAGGSPSDGVLPQQVPNTPDRAAAGDAVAAVHPRRGGRWPLNTSSNPTNTWHAGLLPSRDSSSRESPHRVQKLQRRLLPGATSAAGAFVAARRCHCMPAAQQPASCRPSHLLPRRQTAVRCPEPMYLPRRLQHGSWCSAGPVARGRLKHDRVVRRCSVAAGLLLLLLQEGHVALPGFVLPEVCQG